MQYYKASYGFSDVFTFTDSRELFKDLWKEWRNTHLLAWAKGTPIVELEYKDIFRCMPLENQKKIMKKKRYFMKKAGVRKESPFNWKYIIFSIIVGALVAGVFLKFLSQTIVAEIRKTLFKTTLTTVRKQNEIIKKQREEIERKEDVIIGLVDDISLAEKRQILNRVVRYNHANYQERWKLLCCEFENKYHIDLQKRLDNYNEKNKPKCKNKLDYIDRTMHKVPELYEIAVKLFENDIKALIGEMYQAVTA